MRSATGSLKRVDYIELPIRHFAKNGDFVRCFRCPLAGILPTRGHNMDTLKEPTRIETLVIGGGQAGLSVGYFLSQRKIPFLILDANQRVGDTWRQRWDSLRLFTPARFAGLAGMP